MLRKIIYVLLLIIVMFSAMYTGNNELYIWFYIVVGAPVLSLLILLWASFRIKYTENVNERRLVRGESVRYDLEIHNEDYFLYPYIQTNFFMDTHFNKSLFSTGYIFLFPQKNYVMRKDIECKHTGGFKIGIRDFEMRDYFGFFSIKSPNKMSVKSIYVMPKIHYLAKFANVQGNVEEKVIVSGEKGMLEDYTEIESIDPYIPGIPMKKVHWKASAAKDRLLMKQFSHPNDVSVFLYVDVGTQRVEDEVQLAAKDIMLESCIAVTQYCVNRGITCKALFNDRNISDRNISNRKDFENFYHFMSFMDTKNALPFASLMRNYFQRNFVSRDMIIITANLTEEMMDFVTELKHAGVNVIFICPIVGKDEVLERNHIYINTLRDQKIQVYAIPSADEIADILQT